MSIYRQSSVKNTYSKLQVKLPYVFTYWLLQVYPVKKTKKDYA